MLALFRIKKDFKAIEKDGRLHDFYETAKETIKEAALKELDNEGKKQFVILAVGKFILMRISPINAILGQIFAYLAPFIIDKIYDSLKSKLED